MALTRHVYPHIDLDAMDDLEAFGRLANEAHFVLEKIHGGGSGTEKPKLPAGNKPTKEVVKRTM